MTLYRRGGKRVFDVAAAGVGLFVTAPFMAVVVVSVRRRLGSPVLFSQQRPGREGRPFTLLKFRSMADAVDAQGRALPDEERLGNFGRRLRATSVDEIPELWNVLRGDMSLVGPRPLLMEYLPRYSEEQGRRHDVRPGITGWAQVNGRNDLSWNEKFDLDVWYVDNYSLGLDMKILWRTLTAVLRREGISADGSVSMPPFEGGASEASQG